MNLKQNNMRTVGYYWCHNNKVYKDTDNWRIYLWDGNNFWDDGDDFSEDCFETIDENPIERKETKPTLLYVDTNPETGEKYLPVKICECESSEMANWIGGTLKRDLYEHADNPNRDILFVNC